MMSSSVSIPEETQPLNTRAQRRNNCSIHDILLWCPGGDCHCASIDIIVRGRISKERLSLACPGEEEHWRVYTGKFPSRDFHSSYKESHFICQLFQIDHPHSFRSLGHFKWSYLDTGSFIDGLSTFERRNSILFRFKSGRRRIWFKAQLTIKFFKTLLLIHCNTSHSSGTS